LQEVGLMTDFTFTSEPLFLHLQLGGSKFFIIVLSCLYPSAYRAPETQLPASEVHPRRFATGFTCDAAFFALVEGRSKLIERAQIAWQQRDAVL